MRISLLLLWAFFLGACSPRFISVPEPTQIHPPANEEQIPAGTATAETARLISLAIVDLSTRISVDPAEVRVQSINSQLWPDAALGCPRTGEVYAQQTVPGYRLRLEANGHEFIYHTDQSGTLILCTEDQLPYFPVTPGEIDDEKPWMPAD